MAISRRTSIWFIVLLLATPASGQTQEPIDLRTLQLAKWIPEQATRISDAGQPAAQLGAPVFGGRLSDGRLVIADPKGPFFAIYSSDGAFRNSIGGNGPVQFTGINGYGLCGDSIWVWDARQSHLSMFAPDGRLIYERFLTPLFNHDRSRIVTIIGVDDQRKLRVIFDPLAEDKAGGMFTRFVLQTDPTGTIVLDTISRNVVAEAFYATPQLVFGLPFAPISDGPMQIVGSDRKILIERSAATKAGRAEFAAKVEIGGKVVHEARFAYQPIPTPRDSLRGLLGRLPARAQAAAQGAFQMPEYLPPVTSAVVDAAGRVWLRREAFQAGTPEWLVLDGALKPLATFRFPRDAREQKLTGELFWVVETDTLNQSSVVAYRFPQLADKKQRRMPH